VRNSHRAQIGLMDTSFHLMRITAECSRETGLVKCHRLFYGVHTILRLTIALSLNKHNRSVRMKDEAAKCPFSDAVLFLTTCHSGDGLLF
jgi:hypothetical protein